MTTEPHINAALKWIAGIAGAAFLAFQAWLGVTVQEISKDQSGFLVLVERHSAELKDLNTVSDGRYRTGDAERDFALRDIRDEDFERRIDRLEQLHVDK